MCNLTSKVSPGAFCDAITVIKLGKGGQWLQDASGWWWMRSDGSYPAGTWEMIKGKWYLFDERGYMRTGWVNQNGTWYYLQPNGAMQTGWVCVTGDDSENIEDYRYVDSNGKVRVGWYSAEPPEDLQNNYDHDVEWFYFNNKGVPKVGPERGSATTKDLVKINGNTYLFDEKGVPVYGIQKVYTDSDESEYTSYYFGTRAQSCMIKGKHNIDEGGDTRQFYFSSTGRGYTGVYDNYLYYMGKLQKADSGSRYEVFTIPQGNSYKNYVINTSGRIAKNTTVKDRDGVKYKTNSGGVLVKEDDESVDGGTYSSPEEPDWSAFGDDY